LLVCCRIRGDGSADLLVALLWGMATGKVEVDAETLAAIDRGIKDADAGRTVPIDEVYEMIPKWFSKFESEKPR